MEKHTEITHKKENIDGPINIGGEISNFINKSIKCLCWFITSA